MSLNWVIIPRMTPNSHGKKTNPFMSLYIIKLINNLLTFVRV